MKPTTWNMNSQLLQSGQTQSDIRIKWINWLDQSRWKAINSNFVEDSGKFVCNKIPGVYQVPAKANDPVVFSNENRWNHFTKTIINDPALVQEFVAQDVRPVNGHINPLNPSQVVYPDAFADGIDMRYTVWHGRGPRVTREVVIRKEPSGSNDLRFTWRMSSDKSQVFNNGVHLNKLNAIVRSEVKGRGLTINYEDSTSRGAGIRTPVAWYYLPDGTQVTTPIEVRIKPIRFDRVEFTKIIPRQLVKDAMAAGSPLMSDDTSTFYPDPSVEVTSVDGSCSEGVSSDWSTMRVGVGSGANTTDTYANIEWKAGSNPDQFSFLYRGICLFDTSSINDTHSIDSADLSVYGWIKGDTLNLGDDFQVGVFSSMPASDTDLVAGDFDSVGSTLLSDVIVHSGFSVSGYNALTLNSTGLSTIDSTGISRFSICEDYFDRSNIADSAWLSNKVAYVYWRTAEQSGTSNDPKLVVEHSGVPSGSGSGSGNVTLSIGLGLGL